MSTSQPSLVLPLQSSWPASQRSVHVPFSQVAVACTPTHEAHGSTHSSHRELVVNVGHSTGETQASAYTQHSPSLGFFAQIGETCGTQFGGGTSASGQSSQILPLQTQSPSSAQVQVLQPSPRGMLVPGLQTQSTAVQAHCPDLSHVQSLQPSPDGRVSPGVHSPQSRSVQTHSPPAEQIQRMHSPQVSSPGAHTGQVFWHRHSPAPSHEQSSHLLARSSPGAHSPSFPASGRMLSPPHATSTQQIQVKTPAPTTRRRFSMTAP